MGKAGLWWVALVSKAGLCWFALVSKAGLCWFVVVSGVLCLPHLMSSTGVGGRVAWLPNRITGFLALLTSSMHLWICMAITLMTFDTCIYN